MLRVSPSSPDLAAAYGNMWVVVADAWTDAMFTIDPRCDSIIAGSTARETSHDALRSRAKKSSHSASVNSTGSP